MTKVVRILMALVLVGIGLGSVLFLAGCDDEAVAEATSTPAPTQTPTPTATATPTTESLPKATPAAAEPPEAPGQVAQASGEAEGEQTTLTLSIDELIQQADAYVGQEVVVRGTILTQCIRGCRFSLDDGTGVIGIELVEEALENVLITGSVGRIVEARGIVEGSARPRILVKDLNGWRYVD